MSESRMRPTSSSSSPLSSLPSPRNWARRNWACRNWARYNWACRSAMFLGVLTVTLCGSSTLSPSSAGPQSVVTVGELPAAFAKATPTSLNDLQVIEDHVSKLIGKVKIATVGVQVGRAFGSGVIISADGFILTAGHVSGDKNRIATITLADGRRVNAKTLGANPRVDSGLMKIIGHRTDWPFAEMSPRQNLRRGDWCAALGHPGGVQSGREAVLRLGRVLQIGNELVRTDCELVGGDSGGPLFDMQGRVIGINSRIAERADMNFHVPVALYQDDWDKLVNGDSFDEDDRETETALAQRNGAYLGIKGYANTNGQGVIVTEVVLNSAAATAGIKNGDVVLSFNGNEVASFDKLRDLVRKHAPGRRIAMTIVRGGRTLKLKAQLGEYE